MPNVFTPLTGGGAVVVVVVRPTLGPTQIHIHGLLLLLVVARRVRGNHESGPGWALTAAQGAGWTENCSSFNTTTTPSPPASLNSPDQPANTLRSGCQDELFAKVVFVVTLSSHKAQLDCYNYQQPKWFTCS